MRMTTIATHEHPGQSIAPARMYGVVPAWTATRQTKTKSGS